MSPIRYLDTSSPKVMTRRAWMIVVLNFILRTQPRHSLATVDSVALAFVQPWFSSVLVGCDSVAHFIQPVAGIHDHAVHSELDTLGSCDRCSLLWDPLADFHN